jgi:hypothetical protein
MAFGRGDTEKDVGDNRKVCSVESHYGKGRPIKRARANKGRPDRDNLAHLIILDSREACVRREMKELTVCQEQAVLKPHRMLARASPVAATTAPSPGKSLSCLMRQVTVPDAEGSGL